MEQAFGGSGYKWVLMDSIYSGRNIQMNRLVYSQLAVATVVGTTHHLVKKYEEAKNRNSASNALCEWNDGGYIKNEKSDSLRSKLDSYRLKLYYNAENYINNF